MARPSKSAPVDLSQPQLTAGLIERLHCPAGKSQAFLRDTKAPALRVLVDSGKDPRELERQQAMVQIAPFVRINFALGWLTIAAVLWR